MNVLFVGDIHNHKYIFKDIEKIDKLYNLDKVICLGDYVDDWNTDNHQSLETLNTIFELKRNHPDKYVFIMGNHEFSYLGHPCSGHQYELEEVVTQQLTDNIDLLDLFYSITLDNKEYVCTHAGLTNDFIYGKLGRNGKWKEALSDWNKDKLNHVNEIGYCSYLRGGINEYSSFVWADKKEHYYHNKCNNPIIPYQIIGHSPVTTIVSDEDENYKFTFIDTHSTYRDGRMYGDMSYLLWNNDKFITLHSNKI